VRKIRSSGSVRGVRRNPYPYRDPVIPVQSTVAFAPARHSSQMEATDAARPPPKRRPAGWSQANVYCFIFSMK
jgi:hypothetical protein